MSDPSSPAHSVLQALGFAVFARTDSGALRAVGKAPAWLTELWPALEKANADLPIADASPFFENFLIDAEECWQVGGEQRAESGPWIEEKSNGERIELEALALTAAGEPILLLKRLGEEFAAKKNVLQRARETVIAHQRLNSEIQKKEILLHCVADEMTAALANIITSLRLIEAQDNPPRTKMLLGLAMRGTEEQQKLINRVLEVFSEEIGSIYGSNGERTARAQWATVLPAACTAVESAFAEKQIRLVPPASPNDSPVPLDASHLERVVTGLLENALERTPRGGEVTVSVADETDSLLCRIIDSAPRMSAGAYDDLFSKFGLPGAGSHASALRLHFCRIVIESCGGEIGCEPGDKDGNIFWFRVPKAAAAK
ncbi:MAG: sensor histidine kinase [Chthoniobacterales bacterium]